MIDDKEFETILEHLAELKARNFEQISDKERAEFKLNLSLATSSQKKLLCEALMTPDKTLLRLTHQAEENGFNPVKNLQTIGEEIWELPSCQKEKLKTRLQINSEVIYHANPRNLFSNGTFLDESCPEYKRNTAVAKKIVGDLCGNESAVSKKLNAVLNRYGYQIKLIDDKDARGTPLQGDLSMPNGNAGFSKDENGNKVIVICLNNAAFRPENIDMLPGLLAHETAHLIDFDSRPEGYQGHVQAEESFADICGQQLAERAGYDNRPWQEYLKSADSRDYLSKGEHPSGIFRHDSIAMSRADNPNAVSEYFLSRLGYTETANFSSKALEPAPTRNVSAVPGPSLQQITAYKQAQK